MFALLGAACTLLLTRRQVREARRQQGIAKRQQDILEAQIHFAQEQALTQQFLPVVKMLGRILAPSRVEQPPNLAVIDRLMLEWDITIDAMSAFSSRPQHREAIRTLLMWVGNYLRTFRRFAEGSVTREEMETLRRMVVNKVEAINQSLVDPEAERG
jgi:hypothetical protein